MKRGLPHSKDCFVCGEANPDGFRGKFQTDENQHTFFHFTPRKTMQGYGTVLHGGLQATVLDETMGWATAIVLKRMTIAAELNIRYMNRTPLDADLVAEAWITKADRRLAWAEGIIRDEKGQIYTRAKGKFVPMTLEETKMVDSHLIYSEGDLRVFENLEQDNEKKK